MGTLDKPLRKLDRRQRTTYAHWLDPEYTSFRWPETFVKTRLRYIVEVLKLHAILGDTIFVSDVQVTDSRALLELFCDTEFVRTAPRFLRLVARPTDALGATHQTLQVIESALNRTLRPTWRSSTFRDSEVPKTLARRIQERRPGDTEAFIYVLDKFQIPTNLPIADKSLLEGMKRALKYFADPGSHVIPAQPANSGVHAGGHYDEVLEQAEAEPGLNLSLKEKLQSTLKFVKAANPQAPHERTPAVNALAEAGLGSADNYMHLAHIIQAWNLAVARTVNANTQDVPRFWRAVPVPAFHGNVTEATVPVVNVTIGEKELFESFSHRWHPADLSWTQVALVRNKCAEDIEAFQAHPTASLRRQLLEHAGKVIAESGTSSPSLLVSTDSGLAGELFGSSRKGIRFSTKEIEHLPPWARLASEFFLVAFASAASTPVAMGDLLLQCAEWEIKRREGRKITEIIESHFVRYNLASKEER